MKNKTVVILGSSRSFGNTRKVLDSLLSIRNDIDIIDLNKFDIGYFDYEFKNKNDDFLGLMEKVIAYDTIVFASPVYWYTMRAQLKTFFDRISDLLTEGKKDIGRKLRGKNMAVISCSSDKELINGFAIPFKKSADYLGMTYLGHLHTWLNEKKQLDDKVLRKLKLFSSKL